MSKLRFIKISFTDFKTFRGNHQFDLERQPGLYYVTGRNLLNPELGANGVGKSTIWDALMWILWNKTVRDNKPAAAIMPWGTKGKTEGHLWFNRNGIDHFIYRTRTPNSLRHSQDASDNDVEITQEEIPKLLGMSEAMFRRTLVLGQFGELFLDLKPDAQAQMFTEALDLDVWLKAREAASRDGNVAEREKTKAETTIEVHKNLLQTLGIDIEETETSANRFETDKAARIKKIKAGIETLENDIQEMEENVLEQPSLPDTSKSQALNAKLSDKRVELTLAVSEDRRIGNLVVTATAIHGAFLVQEGVKVCPECKQEISDTEFKKKKAAAKKALDEFLVMLNEQELKTDKVKEEGLALKEQYDQAKAAEAAGGETYVLAMRAFTKYNNEVTAFKGQLQQQRKTLAQEEAAVNVFLESLGRLRTRRQGYRAEHGDLKEKLAAAQRQAEEAAFWVDAFKELRLSVIDQTLIELEMAASRHAAMLGLDDWGIKFDTERETQSGKVSVGFTVLLYPPGQDSPVKWESYSGGESQRWQLAVAFGLSEVLLARAGLSPNIEVLDEPTRGLSSDGVSDLLGHLCDRAIELGRAIYFVDHHSLDKGAFDGTLMISKDKKGSTFKWT